MGEIIFKDNLWIIKDSPSVSYVVVSRWYMLLVRPSVHIIAIYH